MTDPGERLYASWTRGAIFDLIGYKPQVEAVHAYHASEARLRIVSAPARTSKSYAAAHDSIVEGIPPLVRVGTGAWKPKETRLNWIVGVDYSTTKEFDYLWQHFIDGKLKGIFNVESARKNPDQGQMRIVLNLGRSHEGLICRAIWEVKSANHERSLQGEEVHDCILSEAAEHPAKIWERYLATRVKRATWPTTPKQSARWIHEQIVAGDLDKSLSIEHFTFPPGANPGYDWERYDIESKKAASRSTTGRAEDDPWFAEQFLGRWVFYEGRVLPFYEEPGTRGWCHVLDELPRWADAGYWAWSFDYGYTDPYAGLLWTVGMDGTMVVVDGFYERQFSDLDVIERVAEINERNGVTPTLYVGDPKRPQVARYLRDQGLPVYNSSPNQVAKRAPGFRLLINLMSEDPSVGRPKLFIHRCEGTKPLVRELRHIRYKEGVRDEYAEGSMIGDAHALDALRYGAVVLHRRRPSAATHDDWWRQQAWRRRKKQAMGQRSVRVQSTLG